MSATTVQRRPMWRGKHSPRHGVTKILRGASWKAGWVLVAHNDRLMPYPTFGFSSIAEAALTVAQGGPFQIDFGGGRGVLLVALEPGISFQYIVSGTVPVVTTSNGIVTVTGANTASSAAVANALASHAAAARMLMVGLFGDGAGTAGGAVTLTAVPYVRVYGVAQTDVDNSADLVNDATLPIGSPEESCGDAGVYGLEMADTGSAPCTAWLVDNQTVTFVDPNPFSLYLPVPCRSIEDGLAFCDLAVGYR